MNRTTVGSNQKNENNKPSRLASTTIIQTETDMEVPKGTQVFKMIPNYVKEQENIEIPAGTSTISEKSGEVKATTVEDDKIKINGTIMIIDPKQMLQFAEDLKKKKIMEDKIAEIENREKAQVGIEVAD